MDPLSSKERVRRLAERQFGRVSRYQLDLLGIGRGQRRNWVAGGYLIPSLPCVFAVGHQASSVGGDLCEALLYAGPGAMLDGLTASWWHGLVDYREATITAPTPKQCRSYEHVTVHGRRPLIRIWHKHLPTTTIAQTMLDL